MLCMGQLRYVCIGIRRSITIWHGARGPKGYINAVFLETNTKQTKTKPELCLYDLRRVYFSSPSKM